MKALMIQFALTLSRQREIQYEFSPKFQEYSEARPDTWLPKSRASGQGPYLRLLHHFGRSSEAKDHKNLKKVKCDKLTDGPTE